MSVVAIYIKEADCVEISACFLIQHVGHALAVVIPSQKLTC